MISKKRASLIGRAIYCPNKKLLLPLIGLLLSWSHLFAQDNGTKFDISVKKVPLTSVFAQIEAQSSYRVFYLQSALEKAKAVTIVLKGAPLKEILDEAFKGQPLNYKIENTSILVSEKRVANSSTKDSIPLFSAKVVTDEDGKALAGATIKIKETNRISIADANGLFAIRAEGNQTLQVSYIGYRPYEMSISRIDGSTIRLSKQEEALEAVNVVSSGYQYIPKERATGSFDQVDNKTFNRAVSTDVLSRLEGVGNGLLFSKNSGNRLGISIRGRSTLFSNTQPLIVLDNFPYEGDIENINPNDVESITLLKDAAAASIWGTRAGNGVLVITTKRGKFNRPTQVSFNSNITISNKPDLHYQARMNTADFIQMERFLFDKGYYNTAINRKYAEISPVVSLLAQQRSGLISEVEANAQIDKLNGYDILSDMEQYLYQRAVSQQYQVSVTGGGANNSFYLSSGYDREISSAVGNGYNRYTLKAVNTFYGLSQRLQLTTDINFTSSNTFNYTPGYGNPKYPYLRLSDDDGNPVEVNTAGTLNSRYTDTVGGGYLLDWKYRPLEELNKKMNATDGRLNNIIMNVKLSYKLAKGLNIGLYYQYNKSLLDVKTVNDEQSFSVRNQINSFSQINWQTGIVTRPIPLGGTISSTNVESSGNFGRAQVDYQEQWNRHKLNAIAGLEVRSASGSNVYSGTQYGYNRENETYQGVIDQVTLFPLYHSGATSAISTAGNRTSTASRNISYYTNVGYIYGGRYLASVSFRKDESNLFGVDANQRGVPLWSAGLGWNLHQEKFYRFAAIPELKVRLTYGYNGNVDNTTSAYLTAKRITRANLWLNPYNEVVNPPNSDLRWERVENINLGLDFSSKDNVVSGSVEYYVKNGKDLMGYSPLAPQTGLTQFYGNVANTQTKGVDVKVNTINLKRRFFSWETTAIINLNRDKVTKYLVKTGTNSDIVGAVGTIVPISGYPIRAIAGYKYAGLSANGNPIGYLDGHTSEDYTAMVSSSNIDNLDFRGSGVPTFFGSIRNTLRYKSLELSFNILFKAGYYIRTSSFTSATLISGAWLDVRDYPDRWQNPGDENLTNVPGFVYPRNINRDLLYQYSSPLIEEGSHIRLQDIQCNYQLGGLSFGGKKAVLKNANVYLYVNNIGILWRNNNKGIDPNITTGVPLPLSYSIGLKASF